MLFCTHGEGERESPEATTVCNLCNLLLPLSQARHRSAGGGGGGGGKREGGVVCVLWGGGGGEVGRPIWLSINVDNTRPSARALVLRG